MGANILYGISFLKAYVNFQMSYEKSYLIGTQYKENARMKIPWNLLNLRSWIAFLKGAWNF